MAAARAPWHRTNPCPSGTGYLGCPIIRFAHGVFVFVNAQQFAGGNAHTRDLAVAGGGGAGEGWHRCCDDSCGDGNEMRHALGVVDTVLTFGSVCLGE